MPLDKVDIPFRGKVWPCRLSNARVLRAEGELGLAIVSPPTQRIKALWFQPTFYVNGVILYAVLKEAAPGLRDVTLDDCLEAVVGDDRERLAVKIAQVISEFVEPLLERLYRPTPDEEAMPDPGPLAQSSGGGEPGPLPASASE